MRLNAEGYDDSREKKNYNSVLCNAVVAKVESMTRRLITIARLIALLRYRARARR